MTDKNEPGSGSSPADDWADALAEQSRANPPTQADGLKARPGRLGRRHGRADRRLAARRGRRAGARSGRARCAGPGRARRSSRRRSRCSSRWPAPRPAPAPTST